jgi:hypothetical protein
MSAWEKLSTINVNEHVEKKGKFNYLSWTWAVSELKKAAPDATWEVIRFNGFPYLETKLGYFVEVAVTVDGITLSQIHPVLDGNNKTIPTPNAFQINTSIQRCLAKAIALHGLGLYVYAGEDLPEESEEQKQLARKEAIEEFTKKINQSQDVKSIGDVLKYIKEDLRHELIPVATKRKQEILAELKEADFTDSASAQRNQEVA